MILRIEVFLFALSIISISNKLKSQNNKFVISKQLMRSGTAFGALIREAQNAESHKDFIHKMAIAQKECDESIYWMELIQKSDFQVDDKDLKDFIDEASQILIIIRTIILKKKQNTKKTGTS